MSTRWQIAAKLSNGSCGCIYVHCDGYPSHAMNVLQKNYSDQQKIDKLIDLGDLISISPEISECDRFFGRDGEDWEDVKPTFGETLAEVSAAHLHGDEEYRYLWDGNGWFIGEL